MENLNVNKTDNEQDDFWKNLDIKKCRDVHVIERDDCILYLVATAHVSAESKKVVKKAIEDLKPDLLCVELDNQRYEVLTGKRSFNNLNIFEIIKKKKTFFLIAQLALAGFQKKIGDQLGVKPGSDMLEAINIAKEHNIPIALIDREVSLTLKRAWNKTPFFKKITLVSNIIAGFFSKQTINEDELSNLRKSDVVTGLLNDLHKVLPETKSVLVDERDSYLVLKANEAINDLKTSSAKKISGEKKSILIVVGAGHVIGIKKQLSENIKVTIEELENIPDLIWFKKLIPWSIPAAILLAIFYGFYVGDYSGIERGAIIWVISNGLFSSFGAIFAHAHPLSVVIAFIAAPITSLNPTIGCGFIVGLAEAYFRKPKVADFNNLSNDVSTIKGWYKNRLTRILLVFFATTIGSAIGTWVAIPWILAK